MKTRMIATITIATLGIALCTPQPAQAGDKELAAAFVGFAAAAAWMNHHQASERQEAYYHAMPRYTSSRCGTITYRQSYGRHGVTTYRRSHARYGTSTYGRSRGRQGTTVHGRSCSCCQPKYKTRRSHRAPIVRSIGRGKRLYQVPVHGQPALLQRWSSRRNAWLTIGRRPSIW